MKKASHSRKNGKTGLWRPVLWGFRAGWGKTASGVIAMVALLALVLTVALFWKFHSVESSLRIPTVKSVPKNSGKNTGNTIAKKASKKTGKPVATNSGKNSDKHTVKNVLKNALKKTVTRPRAA